MADLLMPHQREVYQALAEAMDTRSLREAWWYSAVRVGKTVAMAMVMARLMLTHPDRSPGDPDYLLVGQTQEAVARNQAPALRAAADSVGAPFSISKTRLRLGRASAAIVGLGREGSHHPYMGMTARGMWADEVSRLTQTGFDELLSRLSLPGAMALCTLNPLAPAHWTKSYIDAAADRRARVWHHTIYANSRLPRAYIDHLEASYRQHPHLYARYILGEWAAAEGLIYQQIQDAPAERTDATGDLWIGVDAGAASITAAVYLVQRPGPRWVVVDEYYHDAAHSPEMQIGDAEHAMRIMALAGRRPIRSIVVDPAAAALRGEIRRLHGHTSAGDNDVLPGIQLLDQAFRDGRLRILKGACPRLRAELASYEWDATAQERGEDKPVKAHDHGPDALRYVAMQIMQRIPTLIPEYFWR